MTVREITSLMWRGHQTAELARRVADRHERVLIHLPSDSITRCSSSSARRRRAVHRRNSMCTTVRGC